jgi:hypothetical protein
MWDSDFDPYEALIQCQNNINQCAQAINYGTEVMKELAAKYNHQQEVIQQLQFQNRKLTAQLNQLQAHAYFNEPKN